MKKLSLLLLILIILQTFSACAARIDRELPSTTGTSEYPTENTTDPTAEATTEATTTATAKREEDFSAAKITVGFARTDITPPLGAPLSYGNIADKIFDNLYATVIAISDGENTVLFISLDLKQAQGAILATTFERAMTYGVTQKNVFVSATHTHSAIDYTQTSNAIVKSWLSTYREKIGTAISDALKDQTEAFIEIGSANTDRLSFTRRYIMKDGSFKGIHTQNPSTDYERHETEADPELQAIKFVRNGKKDVVMVNWQAHAAHAADLIPTSVTSDYVSNFREGAEEKFGILFAYFDGASGNINLSSKIPGKQKYTVFTKVGTALVDVLGKALENTVRVDAGEIKISKTEFEATVNHSRDDKREIALEVVRETDVEKQKELIKKYGFQSKYDAHAIVICSNYEKTVDLPIGVISIGEIAFVTASFEMFDTTGIYIKESSPYLMTFVCTHTNGPYNYIAPEWAFANGGYEVYTTRFIKGTAEDISSTLLDILNKQYTR